MAKKMGDIEVKNLVASEIRSAVGYIGSEVSSSRAENLEYYMSEPFGNEQDGRSQIVTSDAMDTVEWIMPQMMRVFAGSDEAVEFEPKGEEDVAFAKQATDYCNHVWYNDNPGFINLYSMVKDGLIERLGAVKIYWDESEEWERESYVGLTEDALAIILQDDEFEVLEHTEYRSGEMVMGPMGMPQEEILYDLVGKKAMGKVGKVCVDPVPSDEFLISADGKNVQDARFVGHRTHKTRSDLIAEGFNRKIIESLPSEVDFHDTEADYVRSQNDDDFGEGVTNNPAMEEVVVVECYARMDYDGDGIAEMRKIVVAGDESEVLSNEPWDGSRPFAAWTPIIIPHRFFGLSVVDLVKDLQLIRSTLWRQFLDGLYLANTPVYECDTSRIVDPADVLDRKPGTVIRTKGGDSPVMRPVSTIFAGETALRGIDEVDRMRENRTGVSERTQGLGADTLHDTAKGQDQLMTAAMSRIELITRVFAETGFKDCFKIILELSQRYQDKPRTLKIRNEWVEVNPRAWRSNYDVSVAVGLGNGNQEQRAGNATKVLGLLMQGMQMQGGPQGPIVKMENIYRAAKEVIKGAGYKDVDSFLTDPQGQPMPQQPDVSPEEKAAQQKAMMDAKIEEIKASQDYQIKQAEMQADIMLQREKMEMEFQLSREKMDAEMALAHEKNILNASQGGNMAPVRFGGDVG